MKFKILLIATIAIALTLLMSGVSFALTKAKSKKSVKGKVKAVLLKPVQPLLDTLTWMQTWDIPPCADDSLSMTAMSLMHEINNWTKVRYRKGGSTKKGVDCSGFVSNIFKNALALRLPRTSREQYQLGDSISTSDLKLGDLVFFHSNRKRIGHVGIYLGNGEFVHAARKAGVSVASLASSYYTKRFAGARRILSFDFASNEKLNSMGALQQNSDLQTGPALQ